MLTYICHAAYMQGTTIFLPDALPKKLRQEAFRQRISMAELIRRRMEFDAVEPTRSRPDPLAAAEGVVRHGRLSRNIDEALCGD
jgi:hypothetical protein